MTATLKLARNLELPLDAITVTEAIVGIRGSGKTNTAVVEAEDLLEHGQQIVVIDPTDAWWGLKSSKDGERAGYAVVILGGKHEDLPLAAGDGATIADFVVDERASVILSLRHFESKGDVRRFVTDFALRLYYRKGQQDEPTPLKVFIDEASLVVPQRIMGEEARMVGAIQQLVRQGRSSGIGVALIDQRPATINKDVLTQLELLIAHRITSPQDRKALVAWVEQHDVEDQGDEFLDTLASLEQGEAWFWSPGWLDLFKRVRVRERRTFDSSRTPKPGERVAAPTKIAEVDLAALKSKLSKTIEKARADDPAALRKEIARLQAELRKAQGGKPQAIDPAVIDKAVHAAIQKRGALTIRALDKVVSPLSRCGELLGAAGVAIDEVRVAWQNGDGGQSVVVAPPTGRLAQMEVKLPVKGTERSYSPRVQPSITSTATDVSIGAGERRVLAAIAQRLTGVDREYLTVVTGYKRSSRNTYLQRLSAAGLIELSGENVRILNAGIAALGSDFETLPTGAALRDYWLGRLPEGERKILAELIDVYPDAADRETVGSGAGYKRSSRNTYLQRLSARKLVENVGRGEVRASTTLFED